MDIGMIMILTPCWILTMSFNPVGMQVTVLDNREYKDSMLDSDDGF